MDKVRFVLLSLNNMTDASLDYFRDVTCKNESGGLREVTPMACCQGQAGTRFEQGVSGVFEFLYQHTGILGQ